MARSVALREAKNGADDPTRTDDLLITSELLYQLSYVGPDGWLGRSSRLCRKPGSRRRSESLGARGRGRFG